MLLRDTDNSEPSVPLMAFNSHPDKFALSGPSCPYASLFLGSGNPAYYYPPVPQMVAAPLRVEVQLFLRFFKASKYLKLGSHIKLPALGSLD